MAGCSDRNADAAQGTRPNLLVILIDDLGFSDLGVMGSEIRTPVLDELARSGVTFSDFHTAMACSPTRAMLLTGMDHHLVGLGNMAGIISANQKGKPGYEGHLNERAVTVASMLSEAGYRTYMSGKWHLGYEKSQRPDWRGFDRSFALLDAGASYFADRRGLVEYRPVASYVEDGREVEALPGDFHATEYFADKLIEYIDEDRHRPGPFFAYLAVTAPHWPYQLPDDYLDLYAGVYDAGYDELRQRRLDAIRRRGIVANAPDALPRLPGVAAWDELGPEAQRIEARKMELYAATVEYLDQQLGRLFAYLDDIGELDETAVFVLSDNGPEGNDRTRVATNETWLPKAWNLEYENMGRRDSYVFYGAGWAQASAAPFRLFKSYSAEGGTRVPMIVRVPDGHGRGEVDAAFTTVLDIIPTLLDLAAVDHAVSAGKESTGAQRGSSMLPLLRGRVDAVHDASYAFGWELFGHRALRKGRWKLLSLADSNGHWELYDLQADPGEQTDLADRKPDKLRELVGEWEAYMQGNNVILPADGQERAFGY